MLSGGGPTPAGTSMFAIENKVTGFLYMALKVLLVLCGIWSLDFFHSVIPPFCVSSNIVTVHVLALEYLSGILSHFSYYTCIKLHDNNFRPVVWVWKLFHRYFVHFRRTIMGFEGINNQCLHNISASYLFKSTIFVSFTLLYFFHINNNFGGPRKSESVFFQQ